MMTQTTILRDGALAGLAIAGLSSLWGVEAGVAATAGAFGSLLNVLLMALALRGAGAVPSGLVLLRLGLKLGGGLAILVVLVTQFSALPALAGFCAVMAGAGFRAFASLAVPPHTPSEAG